MEKYFSKKLIFLLTVIATLVIVIISSIRFYMKYVEYKHELETDIKARVERIASSIVPSVWELYQKSVERKFSSEFSAKVLDTELKSDEIDAIIIRGQFGHFYMGKYKELDISQNVIVNEMNGLDDFQNRYKKNIISYPIVNGVMTIGSVEVAINDQQFLESFKNSILLNIIEIIIITISFFLLTFYGVNYSLLKPLRKISLATKTLNILNEGVLYLNSDFLVEDLNDSALNILGFTRESLLKRNGFEVFNLHRDTYSEILKERGSLKLEASIKVKDDISKSFMIFLVEILDEKANFLSYALKFEDISDRIILMNDLMKAKEAAEGANSRKSSFLANMSHEIRTPLNSICGFSNLLVTVDDLSSEDIKESLDAINIASHNLLNIINDIIDFSKIEASKIILEKHDFSFYDKLNEIVKMFSIQAAKKNIKFTLENFPTNKIYTSDSYRFTQIINNLVSNAIKFTADGEVKIVAKRNSLSSSLDELVIEVIDNGIGINENARAFIFTPFMQADDSTTRKFGGTGLGLSISKQLANLFEGELDFKPNPNGGTIFYFKFYAKIAKHNKDDKKIIKHVEDLTLINLKILIVDDEKLNRDLLRLYFRKDKNVELSYACDGEEAVEQYKLFTPDVVLLDMHMPKLDGLGALRSMRNFEKINGSTPAKIIIISANTIKDNVERLRGQGADAYLFKPVSAKDLRKEINKLNIRGIKV